VQSRVAPVVRAGAFVRKEIVEVVRQPRLLASLVLGPFLILLLFGVGYQAVRPLDMYVVASEDDFLGQAVIDWAEDSGQAVTVVGTGSDEAEGLRLLESGDVDAVIVVPPSPLETIQQNEKAEFLVIHDELDPFERTAIDFFARTSVDQANDRLLSELAEEGIEIGMSEGSEYEGIDTEVLVAPFSASTEQVQGISVDVTSYYAPAVIVLLLQHAALTFAALSLVRERYLGTADLFRVAPLTAGETLWGKYIGHFAIGGVLAAVLVGASVFALGVPMEGSWWQLGVSVAGVIVASLGWGMVLSSLVDTDAQAVQASMIALLVSIFFSGFMLSLDRLAPMVRPVAWLIPATHGIAALQDVMFRGIQPSLVTWGSLAALAVGLAAIAYLGLRRRMRAT
jgi:ABC-2 type transport system permease protein